MGVCEGTVRYHLRRAAAGAEDGRRRQPRRAETLAEVIRVWMEARQGERRPANVRELHEHLAAEYGYAGSYNSVRRYVRAHYAKPKRRTYRRVETPPGAQTQTDWAEYPRMDVGDGPEPLHAFVMVLSHSRKPAVVWSRDEKLLAWLACHNEAYRRLEGVAAVNRIDNLKTAMASGAGAWGTIHPTYRAYARAVGFHVDACPPRAPQAKGKGEAKVKLSRQLVDVRRRYEGLEELQAETDARIERWARHALCPATGETVQASYERECERLAPLPMLPEPFDVAVTRAVAPDCTLAFEARRYSVPFRLVGRGLEVRGCAGIVQILADGQVVATHPRHTRERLVIDPAHYEGAATAEVAPPPPLGRMGRRLLEIARLPVETRPLDLYAALAEVARCARKEDAAETAPGRDRMPSGNDAILELGRPRIGSPLPMQREWRRVIEPTSGIDDHAGAETEPSGTGRPRWQIAIFQLLFGSMAVALGGLISAEPTLSLDRREDGRLECRYALDAYGWLPTLTASVDDLVRYEVSVGEASGTQGKSSGTPAVFTRTNLRLIGRDGSDFSIGQTFSLLDLDHMIDGSGGPSHSERVAAGPARRYGGRVLGGFGLLLLAGAIWNLGLMASGLGSASAEIG